MKLSAISLVLLLMGITAIGQATQGKIVYQLGFVDPPQDYKRIIMWFSAGTYLYRYEQNAPTSGTAGNAKKYTNIQDSIRNAIIESKFKAAQNEANESQQWYGEIGNDVVTNSTFDAEHKFYCIRDTLGFVNWQLTGDTMTIYHLLCQKAIGKFNEMNYVAWFAPSIPVSVAPLQFRGLPGLLVKETNTTAGTSMVMAEFEWPLKESVTIQPCSGTPYISRKEFKSRINDQNAKTRKIIDDLKKQGKVQERTVNN